MRRQYAVSEDDLVGARKLIDRFETDGEIEGGAFGCRRPQSHSLECGSGVVDQSQHEGTTHHEVVTLGLAGPEKALDIVGKRIKWFDRRVVRP
jgi:hypothetical protein